MEKQLENPEKKSQSSPPRPRAHAPAPPDRWAPRVSGGFCPARFPLPLFAQWGQPVDASCFPPAPFFPLCLAGPFCQTPSRCPARPFSLSLRRGPSLSAPPSPRPPWTSERALAHVAGILGHVALPTPQLLFEPRPCPHALPASFHAVPPSLALCSRRQTSPETRARLPGHLARRRPRQATPSSAPR
jgi:hypothetical protein